jgi:4a-hydroxytetrahydrobiopterin dehydratase
VAVSTQYFHARMDGWLEIDGALERTYELGSFAEAIALVDRVARLAEEENHHPHIAVDYRKVTLRWSTHSANAITDRDRELAARCDDLVWPPG